LIRKGERFAQLVPEKVSYVDAVEVTDFSDHPAKKSEHVGYGSTGKN
jgi:dUTPase